MVGKLAPNSSHLTRGLVKYVLGRGYFRAVPSQNGDKYVTSPAPRNFVLGSKALTVLLFRALGFSTMGYSMFLCYYRENVSQDTSRALSGQAVVNDIALRNSNTCRDKLLRELSSGNPL